MGARPNADRRPLDRYWAAVARLDALIAPVPPPRDLRLPAIRARAEHRLDRLRRFLADLGDPQDAYPVVHVAGTSGKGSTSTAIAAVLSAAGYRVGLHTSPYLQVATEKLQIGGRLIGPDDFADLADAIGTAAASWAARQGEETPTYGEVWTALTTTWFAQARVDVAVIEVGAGGRFDLTNVVRPAVSVITTIGLDHTATLGETIPEIAWHKAGIVKPGAPVVTAVTDRAALRPIVDEAAKVGVGLTRVIPGRTFEVLATGPTGTRWREIGPGGAQGPVLTTPLPGRFQAANAATAVAAVRLLAARGFAVDDAAVRAGVAAARLPGRFEAMPDQTRPRVLLDGAHNPDKMAALAADLPALLAAATGARLIVLLGTLEGKAFAEMVARLVPHAAALVATEPRVLGKTGAPAVDLAAAARATGLRGPLLVEPDPTAALAAALALADGPDDALLVTGSLYLVGEVRRRWYPDDAILRQRTSWPERGGRGPAGTGRA